MTESEEGRIHVLLVEDSPDDALLMERALQKGGLDVTTRRVETREEMADALARGPDVVLADYNLPRFDAEQALSMAREADRDLPFIVVTGTIGEEQAARLLRAGAHDFLLKESLARLAPAVQRELRDARMRREKAAAEAELAQARDRHHALVESASDATYVVDPEGTILFSSPASLQLIGLEPHDVVGRNAFEFVHPDDRALVQRELASVVQSGERRTAEYRIVRPDGEIRHVESVATNLLEREAVAGVVVNTRDLTERKELEAQLRQSQKLEAIGRLAGGIAHDFNNLLTVISGNTRMILEEFEPGSDARDDGEQVLAAAERAAGLTRQLLAFSKSQVMNVRVVDVAEVVRGVGDMLQRLMGEDVELSVRLPDGEAYSRLDPVQLEQVLMNLAVNAREAMPRGGRVAVTVDLPDPDDLRLDPQVARQERWIRLVFRDDGPGIAPELRERIFEPFFSTKELGTGLGLATVYGIVTQTGGRVRVDESSSGGACFVILLPRAETPAHVEGGPEATAEEQVAGARGARILVVEDSPDVRRVTRRILLREGFRVEEAESGERALELIRGNGELDLMVTDLVMPGMPGAELARELRVLRPGVPVLYMSGYSGDEALDPDEVADHGAFLEKPFTPQELSAAVLRLLSRRRR